MSSNPGDTSPSGNLSPEPQSERGAPGSRDTGSDEPGGGPVDRTAGSIEHEEIQSADESDPGAGGGTVPPSDTDAPAPPYAGRKTSTDAAPSGTTDDAATGGATGPTPTGGG